MNFLSRRQPRNPDRVFPVVLTKDNSPSVFAVGGHLHMDAGLRQLSDAMRLDPVIAKSVEVCVLEFGLVETVTKVVDFVTPAAFVPPPTESSLTTPFFEAYARSVYEVLERQKIVREVEGRDYGHGWIFQWSDGLAGDPEKRGLAMAAKAAAAEHGVETFFFGVGPKEHIDFEVLRELSQTERPPLWMPRVENFRQFFKWLEISLHRRSTSRNGEPVEMPNVFIENNNPVGWAGSA
jgi:uncharacterized protein YegL